MTQPNLSFDLKINLVFVRLMWPVSRNSNLSHGFYLTSTTCPISRMPTMWCSTISEPIAAFSGCFCWNHLSDDGGSSTHCYWNIWINMASLHGRRVGNAAERIWYYRFHFMLCAFGKIQMNVSYMAKADDVQNKSDLSETKIFNPVHCGYGAGLKLWIL